jgi:hypothetical protein
MTDGRLADIERWLEACGQEEPATEWAHVVKELIVALKAEMAKVRTTPPADGPDGLLDTAAVAKICQVAPRTVSMWCDRGRLKCHRHPVTNNRLICRADLEEFMRQNGTATSSDESLFEVKA